jgi:hypothetical protein
MRFWWSAVTLAGDPNLLTFDVQIVLLDRSKGTNNGDFDIEFNYGNGEQIPPVGTESNPNAGGFRGFKLGPNSRGPATGPFGPFDHHGAPIRFCFRAGPAGELQLTAKQCLPGVQGVPVLLELLDLAVVVRT